MGGSVQAMMLGNSVPGHLTLLDNSRARTRCVVGAGGVVSLDYHLSFYID